MHINERIQGVIESDTCTHLVNLLTHRSTDVQFSSLRTIGNIVVHGDGYQTQAVITSGALPALLPLPSSPKNEIRKEACWTISNITAGSPSQIKAVLDANIIPALIGILQDDDVGTKKDTCYAIVNASYGWPGSIPYLVRQGCIQTFCDLLKLADNEIFRSALDGLYNILRVGEIDRINKGHTVNLYAIDVEITGGLDTIQKVGKNAMRAANIMDKYFPVCTVCTLRTNQATRLIFKKNSSPQFSAVIS